MEIIAKSGEYWNIVGTQNSMLSKWVKLGGTTVRNKIHLVVWERVDILKVRRSHIDVIPYPRYEIYQRFP